MSTLDSAPLRTERDETRSRFESLRILARLTLLEARRGPMPFMIPLVALLFWFDALRTGQNLPALWTQRAAILPDHVLPDLGPIAAGMAAWVAGREHRRGMADLAESTARPRWLRELAAWAGAAAWTLLVYAACVTVVYVLAARVVTWGGPPIWPIVVTGLGVALFCTAGFVAGALFPGRYTAPLAAIGTLFVSVFVLQNAVNSGAGWILLSPDNRVPPLDWGVFHPIPQGLSIVQTLFLLGAITVLLGVLGVVGSVRGAELRRTAGSVLALGTVACAVCFALAATATTGDYGYVVPAFGDASRQIPYTPVCTADTAPVCIHPAFSADLDRASAVLGPVLDEVAGLPGAPARAAQVDADDLPGGDNSSPTSSLSEFGVGIFLDTSAPGGPVLEYGFDDQVVFTQPTTSMYLRSQVAQAVFGYLVAPGGRADEAQQAVEAGLSRAAGATAPDVSGTVNAAAAQGFAALSAPQRHAWLLAHLTQLRDGQITIKELP
jgi:hypothetical protein